MQMEISIILLAAVCVAALIWCWRLHRALDELLEMTSDLAMHVTEREDWENKTFERHDARIQAASDAACGAVNERNERYEKLENRIEDLSKRVDAFDEAALEAIRAQTDADLAFAEGVRSIAGFGTSVPRLNVESLNHE